MGPRCSAGSYALLQRLEGLPLDRPLSLVYLAPSLGMASPPPRSASELAELAEIEHRRYPEAWRAFRSLLVPALR